MGVANLPLKTRQIFYNLRLLKWSIHNECKSALFNFQSAIMLQKCKKKKEFTIGKKDYKYLASKYVFFHIVLKDKTNLISLKEEK